MDNGEAILEGAEVARCLRFQERQVGRLIVVEGGVSCLTYVCRIPDESDDVGPVWWIWEVDSCWWDSGNWVSCRIPSWVGCQGKELLSFLRK